MPLRAVEQLKLLISLENRGAAAQLIQVDLLQHGIGSIAQLAQHIASKHGATPDEVAFRGYEVADGRCGSLHYMYYGVVEDAPLAGPVSWAFARPSDDRLKCQASARAVALYQMMEAEDIPPLHCKIVLQEGRRRSASGRRPAADELGVVVETRTGKRIELPLTHATTVEELAAMIEDKEGGCAATAAAWLLIS